MSRGAVDDLNRSRCPGKGDKTSAPTFRDYRRAKVLRGVLVQCAKCGATCSARRRNGRIDGLAIPAGVNRSGPYHLGCGGALHAFDILEGGDA